MATKQAIAVFEDIYRRTDRQIRDILDAQQPGLAEVDTINVIVGDGATVLTTGIKAALRVDFNAIITGSFLHEFDGTSGSVVIAITSGTYPTPTFTNITGTSPPTITSGHYGEDTDLTGWTTQINRGDVLLFSITSVSLFTRLLITLRIRRLEP